MVWRLWPTGYARLALSWNTASTSQITVSSL